MSAKELVVTAMDGLPDSATLDRIYDEIELLASNRRGEEDIAAGRVHTHEEVRREIAMFASIRRGEEDADAGRTYTIEDVRDHLERCLGA